MLNAPGTLDEFSRAIASSPNGATAAVAVDAATFLLSAIGVRRLRSREPEPPPRAAGRRWLGEVTGGWRYIAAHRDLHLLFWNAMAFGGLLMAASPP